MKTARLVPGLFGREVSARFEHLDL